MKKMKEHLRTILPKLLIYYKNNMKNIFKILKPNHGLLLVISGINFFPKKISMYSLFILNIICFDINRERLKHIWERVKNEISKQDTRIRSALHEVNGEKLNVWQWVKSAASSPKKVNSVCKY